MNILIVHAHHEPQSFNGAMTREACSALAAAGHHVVVSDLHSMGFNPVSDRRNFTTVKNPAFLKQQAEETYACEHAGFAPDVEAEIAKVLACDAMIFQFPLWWFSMPAILKGWIDRVFASGRLYGGGKWYEKGVCHGKRAMIAMTTGGGPSMYAGRGLNPSLDSILRPIQHGVFWFTGFDVVPPFIAWSAGRASDEQRAAMLVDYRSHLSELFTAPAIRYTSLADCDERFVERVGRFMVAWTWNGPDSPEIEGLIKAERTLLEAWQAQGVLLERYIAADECSGWLLLREQSETTLESRLATLPLRRWLDMKVTRVQ
jgi:NAD(P)H dehydrogenase (quinone)